MKKSLKLLATRIDALSLRERAFLLLSVIAVCVALANVLWAAPARLAYQQVTRNFAQQNLELQRLREELQAKAAQPDPARQAREELGRLNAAIAAANQDIAALSRSSRGVMTLPEVLVHFLHRQAGLTLVRTGNLGSDAAGADASPDVRPVPSGTPALVRQGLELTVSGPYPELVRYVQTLETAMPDLRWGALKLTAGQQPPELGLQVFVIRPRQ